MLGTPVGKLEGPMLGILLGPDLDPAGGWRLGLGLIVLLGKLELLLSGTALVMCVEPLLGMLIGTELDTAVG